MARHYNPSIVSRASRILNSKNGDFLGDQVMGPMAVIDVNIPRINILRQVTSASTIYTTPTDKDFFLTNLMMSGSKVATDSGTALSVTCVVGGATVTLSRFISATLTAFEQSAIMQWQSICLKIDRGTAITLSIGGAWTGVCAQIQGYTEEVTQN